MGEKKEAPVDKTGANKLHPVASTEYNAGRAVSVKRRELLVKAAALSREEIERRFCALGAETAEAALIACAIHLEFERISAARKPRQEGWVYYAALNDHALRDRGFVAQRRLPYTWRNRLDMILQAMLNAVVSP